MSLRSLFLCCILFVTQLVGHAQITSTFDTNADGWTTSGATGSPTPIYTTTGGNPGGRIRAADLFSAAAPAFSFFRAPNKFLGNLCSAYGRNIRYDIQQSPPVRSYANIPNVFISNGSITLEYRPTVQIYPALEPAWTTYSVPLIEGVEWLNSATGAQATKEEMKSVLCNLTSLFIRGRYGLGSEGVSGLDNVIVETLPSIPPPAIASFSPESANVNSTIVITGTGFGATAGNNTVFFGSIQATVIAATTTQLQVSVPAGARFGPLTVLNNTTKLISQSLRSFDPAFADGGPIIPASLKLRQEINASSTAGNAVAGMSLADLDKDGWVDIIVTETTEGVSIFRNLGTGGTITPASFAPKTTLTQANGKLRVADIDGDGRQDIAVLYRDVANNRGFVTFYRNTSSAGAISFVLDDVMQAPSQNVMDIQLADMDGDGRLDLLQSFFDGCTPGGFAFGTWQGMSIPGNIEFCAYINADADAFCASNEISIGDFNNDKKPDVAVVNNNNTQFHILENTSVTGTITFAAPRLITGVVAVRGSVNVADLNKDTKPDLAWRSSLTNDVRIRINTNAGGAIAAADFSTEVILQSSLNATDGVLTVADINGDGSPDLLATDDLDVGIFENIYSTGPLTASSFSFYEYQGSSSLSRPTGVEAADLNGDTRADLVYGTQSTSPPKIMLFENINTHTPAISITTVSPLRGPVGSSVTITGNYFSSVPTENIVHFGGVRAPVLSATKNIITVLVPAGATYAPVSVTCNQLTSQYHLPFDVVFSPGVSSFSASSFGPQVNFTLTSADYDLDAADLNGDNKIDVIAEALGAFGAPQTYSFRNIHTTGAITTSSLIADDTTFSNARNPKLVDLNGDDKPDLATLDGISRNVSVGAEIAFDPLVGPGATMFIGIADFNHDGRMDLTGVNGTNAEVYENWTRLGLFASGTYPSLSSAFNLVKPGIGGATAAADFDNDGWADIVASNPTTDNITVWKNTGGYRVSATMFTSVGNMTTLDSPVRIHVADLDIDGKIDIVTYHGTSTTSKTISVFHNQSTSGAISFVRQDFNLVSTVPTEVITTMGIGDVDGDGRPEMIMVSEAANSFRIWKNNTLPGTINSTSFTASAAIAITSPRAVIIADINSDNKSDLVFTRAGFLTIMENRLAASVISFTTQPSSTTICSGASGTLTTMATGDTNLQYQWQVFNGSIYVNLINDATYSNVNTSTLVITNATSAINGATYRVIVRGDFASPAISSTASLTVAALPVAPAVTGSIGCLGTSLALNASGSTNGNYRWYDVATGGTPIAGAVNNSFTTPALTSTTLYYVSINNGSCESVRTIANATINTPPAKPVITSSITPSSGTVSICNNSVTLSAPAGFASYLWSSGEVTQQVTVSTPGIFTVQVIDANSCTSVASDPINVITATALCNSAPVITPKPVTAVVDDTHTENILGQIKDDDNNLDLTTLRIVRQPTSGAPATINANGDLVINYKGISFSGTDRITIEVCDFAGSCTQQVITIEVIGDIKIFNAISANGDNQNPIFRLEYITLFPDTEKNHVTIYNRWGDVVFEISNYDNGTRAFKGENNNGNELPSGTYFYKIDFSGKRKTKTGYLTLKR